MRPRKVDLFGVNISVTDYDSSIEAIFRAVERRQSAVVACQAVNAVVTASRDDELRRRVNSFELVTPDGQPVRWAMNLLHKTQMRERVYGPELMLRLCRRAAEKDVGIYLYGGTLPVLEKLQNKLRSSCRNLQIAGAYSPPFRKLTRQEDRDVVNDINSSGAGLVFIGLGCPKQDHFAYEHRGSVRAVQLCVGAAFDFHAGVKKMAPKWMQRNGLEWAFRLYQEPRRLWKRYLETNSIFIQQFATAFWYRSRPKKKSNELAVELASAEPSTSGTLLQNLKNRHGDLASLGSFLN